MMLFAFLEPWVPVREYKTTLGSKSSGRKSFPGIHCTRWPCALSLNGQNFDDVLYEVDCLEHPYAVVHLSWTGEPEHNPQMAGYATFLGMGTVGRTSHKNGPMWSFLPDSTHYPQATQHRCTIAAKGLVYGSNEAMRVAGARFRFTTRREYLANTLRSVGRASVMPRWARLTWPVRWPPAPRLSVGLSRRRCRAACPSRFPE